MKKTTRNRKLLNAAAAILCLVMAAALIQIIVTMVGTGAGGSAGGEDLSAYDVVFSGKVTILDEPYEVVLKGSNGTFTVDANTIQDVVKGKYTFTEKQGWTFTFFDSMETCVRSQYNAEEKAHGFVYNLDMGSRGSANLRLTKQDKGFSADPSPWNDIPAFSGNAGWFGGAINGNIACACDADGNFKIFCTDAEITPICGTYSINEGTYIFKAEDGTIYTSAKNTETGTPEFTVTVHRPALEAYNAADTDAVLTLVVLTVD